MALTWSMIGVESREKLRTAMKCLSGIVSKRVTKCKRPLVLQCGGLFDAPDLIGVAQEIRGDVIDIVTAVLDAEVGPVVRGATRIVLTAVSLSLMRQRQVQRKGQTLDRRGGLRLYGRGRDTRGRLCVPGT